MYRGVSRTSAASEMEFFVIIVYSYKSLTIFKENSVTDILRGPGSAYDNVYIYLYIYIDIDIDIDR